MVAEVGGLWTGFDWGLRVPTWAPLHSRFPSSSASQGRARNEENLEEAHDTSSKRSVDGSVFDAEEIVVSTLETMRAVDEVVQYFSGGDIMAWRRFSMKPETAPEESKCHDKIFFCFAIFTGASIYGGSFLCHFLSNYYFPSSLYQTNDDNYGRARLRIF